MSEEKFACPKCGTLVSKGDRFCKNCGASLIEVSAPELPLPVALEQKIEQPYERKFSLVQRFYKLLTAPSEAMEDIALAPDYGGVAVIIAIEAVFAILSVVALVFQKIQFVGTHATRITSFVSLVLTFGCVLGIALVVVRWLIKALIVKYACDSGSSWDFKTAASVTGYAYLASTVVTVIGGCVSWFFIPSFTVDTTDLQAAMQSVNAYRAQINWIILAYSLPVSFVGLIWKSYLGGLGTHFGTKERCSVGTGTALFFILGLIMLLISLIGLL